MKRGDIVIASLPGDYGKPRPAVVAQTDRLSGSDSVILCPFTSDPVPAGAIRITVAPTPENGLRLNSQIMVEKLTETPRSRCREVIGKLTEAEIRRLDEVLALILGLAD